MIRAVRNYLVFLRRCAGIAFVGDWRYLAWMGALSVFCLLGLNAYCKQLVDGLVIPGFVPTPLGEIMEYQPSLNETLVCLGIWAFGLLCYAIFLRMSVPILQGTLTQANEECAA